MSLTPKQRECLEAIDFLTTDGISPTYDEIMEALGIKSKSGVHRLVHGLADRGVLVFWPGLRRTLEITEKGRRILDGHLAGTTAPNLPNFKHYSRFDLERIIQSATRELEARP